MDLTVCFTVTSPGTKEEEEEAEEEEKTQVQSLPAEITGLTGQALLRQEERKSLAVTGSPPPGKVSLNPRD